MVAGVVKGYCVSTNGRLTVNEFITGWIDQNVRSHPIPSDIGHAMSELAEQCLAAAAVVGISGADIESATGHQASDLILGIFLARWNPASGSGGSAS
jgi:hypothetical protein